MDVDLREIASGAMKDYQVGFTGGGGDLYYTVGGVVSCMPYEDGGIQIVAVQTEISILKSCTTSVETVIISKLCFGNLPQTGLGRRSPDGLFYRLCEEYAGPHDQPHHRHKNKLHDNTLFRYYALIVQLLAGSAY